MKSRNRLIIICAVYMLVLIALLTYFNKKRADEYMYTADFGYFTVDYGQYIADKGVLFIDESYGADGVFAQAPGMQFRTGEYDITVNYLATGNNTIHMSANANYEEYVSLPASQTQVTERVTIYPDADEFRIWLIYNGSGALMINSIVVTSQTPLYTDYEYFMILTLLAGIMLPLSILYLHRKKGYNREDWIETGILTVLTILMNFPVFYGYLWMGVDMRPHLMRIDGVSGCINALRFPTIIYSNYCNGFGELSCIYPDKFLYLPGLLRKFGVSLLATYDTMHVLVNTAAIVIMYKCVRYITQNRKSAFISAIMFSFIPFRMYIMGFNSQTMGNGIAMLFFPVVFTGLYDIFFMKGRRWYLLSIGMASLMCCHVLSTVLAAVLCMVTLVYSVIMIIIGRRRTDSTKWGNTPGNIVKYLVLSGAVCAILCLSTLVPFVYYYRRGLNMGKMSLDFLASLNHLYEDYLQENGLFHLITLAVVIILIILLKRAKVSFRNTYSLFCIFMLIIGFGLFYMSTALFPWGLVAKITFIYKKLCLLQFAERFMLAGCGGLCIGFGMLFKMFVDNVEMTKTIKRAVIGFMVAGVLLGCSETYRGIERCDMLIPDRMSGSFYYRQLGYLPPGTEIDYYESKVPVFDDWDNIEHVSFAKVGTDINYVYRNQAEGNYIELPLFYYDGYHAYDETGRELEIRVSEHNRICVDLATGPEKHTLNVVFTVNPLFYLCAGISAFSTLLLYLFILYWDGDRL